MPAGVWIVVGKSSARARGIALLFALAIAAFLIACGSDETTESQTAPLASRTQAENSAESEAAEPATSRPGRIILVSLDTVGAQYIAGYSDADTPNIARLAAAGARFERFYAASTYTLPSHLSIMTGLSPIEHGVVNFTSKLSPDVPTLATQLKKAGYTTRGFHEGGFMGPDFGIDQGFQSYEQRDQKDMAGLSLWGALRWMREMGDEPYFLFIHTYVAHAPYRGFEDTRDNHPELGLPSPERVAELKEQYNKEAHLNIFPPASEIPPELRSMCTLYNIISDHPTNFLGCGERFIFEGFTTDPKFGGYRDAMITSHRAEIRRGDMMIGRLRDLLAELGQWDETLLIVTSDHGDAMFEHGVQGHNYLPFDEVLKVPLVLSYPSRLAGGQVINGLTWHLDLLPTILSLTGLPVPEHLRGLDLSGVLSGGEAIPDDRVIHPTLMRPANQSFMPMRRMVLKGDLKYIEGHPDYGDPEGLLFDLRASPGEDENLRESHPDEFAELQALSRDYAASLRPGSPIHQVTGEKISAFPGAVERIEYSEEMQRDLEALGYIQE